MAAIANQAGDELRLSISQSPIWGLAKEPGLPLFNEDDFRKKADRTQRHEDAQKEWKGMSEDARKLRPELHPDNFKPTMGS